MSEALAARARQVEATWRRIHDERMRDLPLINPRVGIHAVGLRPWEGGLLGVLVTPWCMNLLSLPGANDDWSDKPVLAQESLTFPSGRYTFTVGEEAGLGKYRICSLFSPMFEFADDRAALDTAEAVMRELLREENRETPDIDGREIAARWHGEDAPSAETPPTEALEDRLQRPVSRRALLRGMLPATPEDPSA